MGHGTRRREESAEQHHTHDKKPHDEHGLLQRFAVIGYSKPQRREKQCQQDSQQIDEPQGTLTGYAIDSPGQYEAES